ncbi:polysaccharide deacetylase family protein [Pseudoduganella sp. RAF19]|uniref:polysaccharide deacetylase family protein n=1 Tax=Pseudoduganella sp. RAF19 TaxID=3233052 RepID=UPI003F9EBA34
MNTSRCSLFLGLITVALSAAAAEPFNIAITVDDLPAHGGRLPPGATRNSIAETFIRTLKAHGVPEAYGFVNARALAVEPASVQVLDMWRQAGFPLGNHTYSHLNLDAAETQDAWEGDVIAGEPVIAQRMAGANWHYFRFPNLAAGNDLVKRESARAFLRGRGYRIADVSVSFDDWEYTDAYTRCVTKGDNTSIEAMRAQFMKGVDDEIARMKSESQQVYGRMIPQVLLTHIGAFSAITLDDVLRRLDAAGAHYVTLAQAQADPAYAQPGSGTVIGRTAKERGIQLPAPKGDKLDLASLCR